MFTHLHLHTEYSVLDGYIRLPELMEHVHKLGQSAVAITDHGTLAAMSKAYNYALEFNVQLIPGCEFYIVPDRTQVRGQRNRHFLMLARNEQGWKNLLALNTEAYRTGRTMAFDRVVPRIDPTLLTRENCEGIIATSGCMASEIPVLLDVGREQEAFDLSQRYLEIFDKLYLEVQTYHSGEAGQKQEIINHRIWRLAERTGLSCIVATDSHYLTKDEEAAHELLLAIQSKKTIHDEDKFYFTATPVISEEEIRRQGFNKEIETTEEIRQLCEEPHYLATDGFQIPSFDVDVNEKEYREYCERLGVDGETRLNNKTYFDFRLQEGWDKRIEPKLRKKSAEERKAYEERKQEEYDIITSMGFVDVYLIVADFIRWARTQNIKTGPGRGSVGGSLLAYLMGITVIDPLRYDLLFSRFLNVDRVTLPDIDTDIDQSRREEVRAYLVEKYGQERTASISTFGKMKLRACVRDVIRSLDLLDTKAENFALANQIASTIPSDIIEISYEEAIESIEEFKQFMEQYPEIADHVQRFEGLIRQTGIHAAGMIVGTEPLVNRLPLVVDKNEVTAVAYDGSTLDNAGYFKLDLLGLNNLTIIRTILESVEERGKEFLGFQLTGYPVNSRGVVSMPNYPRENKLQATKTYELLRKGDTVGVFQVESQGMRNLLRGVNVNSIEDLADVLALYRPGPLSSGLTGEYGARKLGRKAFDYLHPSLEPILSKTYGIIVHQEQVMAIAHQCAGFTLSEADTLRRGIAKKKPEIVERLKGQFKQGCQDVAGMPKEAVEALWKQIQGFDSYGFPKAHSIGYAIIAYEMAFLKANYPTEFWSAIITLDSHDSARINELIREARMAGMKILPVDINQSKRYYAIDDENILRRNFDCVKGVGAKAIIDIVENQPYTSLCDFASRTGRPVNIKVIKALIKAGAFDGAFETNYNRWVYEAGIEDCQSELKKWKARKKRKKNPETSAFEFEWDAYLEAQPWSFDKTLQIEIEVYGTPVSCHPFDGCIDHEAAFERRVAGTQYIPFRLGQSELDDFSADTVVYLFCQIKGIKRKIPYSNQDKHPGKHIYILDVLDRTGEGDLFLFNDDYVKNRDDLKAGSIITVRAVINEYNGRRSLRFTQVMDVAKAIISPPKPASPFEEF